MRENILVRADNRGKYFTEKFNTERGEVLGVDWTEECDGLWEMGDNIPVKYPAYFGKLVLRSGNEPERDHQQHHVDTRVHVRDP